MLNLYAVNWKVGVCGPIEAVTTHQLKLTMINIQISK
jgi:hypothetical protein